MAIDAKSYLVVRLIPAENASRPGRGHVIDVREISRPVGTAEKPPMFLIVHSERTVAENQYLLEEDGYWENLGFAEPLWVATARRKVFLDINQLADTGTTPLTGQERADFVKKLKTGDLGRVDFIPSTVVDAVTKNEKDRV